MLIFSLTGCVNLTPHLGFDEVSKTFTKKTGQKIYWRSGSEEDQQVDAQIEKLLARELTVDAATQIALLNNRELQATYQSLGVAQADLVLAGLFSNPIFGGEIRFPDGKPNLELSVVQNFIRLFEIPLRKKIAKAQFEESKLNVIEQALSLSYQVQKTFYKYQALLQLLEMSQTALIAFEASADLANRLHKAGNINDLDFAQEQANYQALRIDITTLEEEVVEHREQLNALMGLTPKQINWTIAQRLPEASDFTKQLPSLEKEALINNLALAQARQKILALANTLDIAEQFRIFSDSELGISGAKETGDSWGFGPAFNFPVPLFNQGQPEIFRAHAELERQYNLAANLQTQIQAGLRARIKRLKIIDHRVVSYKNVLLPLQATVLAETQKQYNSMLIGAFQLLQAKNNQIQIGKGYILTLRDYWLIRAELEAARNGLSLEKID